MCWNSLANTWPNQAQQCNFKKMFFLYCILTQYLIESPLPDNTNFEKKNVNITPISKSTWIFISQIIMKVLGQKTQNNLCSRQIIVPPRPHRPIHSPWLRRNQIFIYYQIIRRFLRDIVCIMQIILATLFIFNLIFNFSNFKTNKKIIILRREFYT